MGSGIYKVYKLLYKPYYIKKQNKWLKKNVYVLQDITTVIIEPHVKTIC